jgi:hypothetical protein
MNLTRTVAVGVGGGALVTWLAWAATPAPRPYAPRRAAAPPGSQSGADLAREIQRLHERLAPVAAPSLRRDVFAFPDASPPAARSARAADAAPPAAAAVPRAPDLTLAGMAEDPGPDGPVRTAIISSDRGVSLVKEGDMVASRYRVERLSADAADLRDLDTGAEVHLALR